ncbi:acyl-CoA dehydrogenase family protein [Variovorax sp. KBS0712]|uniref:acyl-CoA dehydrogenase family protein n=1 Tax=Variovorax sp. KBS0712 TaxID=2578111 RepID=UPI00111B560C|nr:acyl-CoA dehydrogenase family protein [Variovorax sp. KBS0712]TSD56662.1 acyl-CoA dehydrogenase family protein [Variovorax sp. KBS0712]
MEFALSADQKLLQDSLRRALERACPLDRVRRVAADDLPQDREVWRTLCEVGVPALLVPEAFGGLGLSLLDAALAAEELGRHVAPTPFLGTAVLAPLALREAGSAAQQDEWLPRLAAGECIAGVAIAEAVAGARDGAGVTANTNGTLDGSALFVLDAGAADVFIVADRAGGLHLVRADAQGLTRGSLRNIDATRPLGELHFAQVKAEPLPHANPATLARLRSAGWALLAADTLGAGEAMIGQAVAYAKERRQFGRVIGSFQAVKHLCAEMAAALEPGRALVWYAAHAFDALPEEAALLAAHAKSHLSETGTFVARTATEVHGGMGITDLLGLHYWFKRIGFNRQLLGGPERVRHLAAEMQGLVAA